MTRSEITDLLRPLTPAQRIRAAIYAAQSLGSHGPVWDAWAGRWLDGSDRSEEAAWPAEAVAEAEAAWAAARAATWPAEAVAEAEAAWAEARAATWRSEAARAAGRAEWSAEAEEVAWAARAARAEAAARAAAPWTARAAAAAIRVRRDLDLAEITRRAVQDEPAADVRISPEVTK